MAQFGLPIGGVSVLMQRLSERLTSPIAGVGVYSKDCVFIRKKCAGTSGAPLVQVTIQVSKEAFNGKVPAYACVQLQR